MILTKSNKTWLPLIIGLIFSSLYLLTSCSEEAMSRLNVKPSAFGKANHITVIADKDVWEGAVGDTFRYYFASAFLILPQPEPVFDLKHFTPDDLASHPIRKELRTYVLLGNIEDANSATAKLMKENIGPERVRKAKEENGYGNLQKKDKWARGQLVLYMFGTDDKSMMANIKTAYPSIAKKIQDGDKKILEGAIYAGGESRLLGQNIQDKMGLQIRVPNEYFLAMEESNIIWLRRETAEMSSNILIHKLPYTDRAQLSYEGFKSLRDTISKQYISSTVPGSYMRINDQALPMFVNPIQHQGLYAVEARGIWELTQDYMGGSFVSYLIHHPTSGELYLLDGFVFAPGKKKREFMQYLEYILSNATIL